MWEKDNFHVRSFFMRYPGGKAKAVTFSYDDGAVADRRLSDIFTKYGMKVTFNLNCECCHGRSFSKEEMDEIYFNRGHEVAIHGEFHRANGNTRPIEGIRDVLNCRLELEEKCGRIIRGMAYPDSGIRSFGNLGTYQSVKQYLEELDIAYARTLGEDNQSFRLPQDFHAWMPSTAHANPEIMTYVDNFLVLDTSTKIYHAARYPRLLYIWGHSFEFDKDNNWELIEEICARLADNEEIWYATNIEIYDYVQAYKSLVYSANGRLIHNPTLFEIWFDADGRLFSVKPGETIKL